MVENLKLAGEEPFPGPFVELQEELDENPQPQPEPVNPPPAK